jgi:hypothetical protein
MLFRNLHVKVAEMKSPESRLEAEAQQSRTRSLVMPFAFVHLDHEAGNVKIRRDGAGIGADEAAAKILSLASVISKAGASFSVLIDADDFLIARFPGALQRQFLAAGYGLDDLKAGLDRAVERGWLKESSRAGLCAEVQIYSITEAVAIAPSNKE